MLKVNSRVLADCILVATFTAILAGMGLAIVMAARSQLHEAAPTFQKVGTDSTERPAMFGMHPATVGEERQRELHVFVDTYCSACHGTGLTGSIGPPLSRVALAHLSTSAVASTILYGRLEKGMPPWETQLTESDAYWMAEFLKQNEVLE